MSAATGALDIQALGEVLGRLEAAGYDFVTPTPATHARVAERLDRARPGHLRDIFGWTRPFDAADLPAALVEALERAGVVRSAGDGLAALTVRVSRLDGRLVLHSARSIEADAVFLGPDSYRFVNLIDQVLADGRPVARALDIGAGAGAGALAVAARRPGASVIGGDLNATALRYLDVNAAHAGLDVRPVHGDGLGAVDGAFDLIVANPPYIAGRGGRLYRDGGGLMGAELALDWVRAGLPRLTVGGRFVLYTGAAVVEGVDGVRTALEGLLTEDIALAYRELDPDVFGGLLARDDYREVERIAAVGAVLTRRC